MDYGAFAKLYLFNSSFDGGFGKLSREGNIDAPLDQAIEHQVVDDLFLHQTLRLEIFFESAVQNRGVLPFVRKNSSSFDPMPRSISA